MRNGEYGTVFRQYRTQYGTTLPSHVFCAGALNSSYLYVLRGFRQLLSALRRAVDRVGQVFRRQLPYVLEVESCGLNCVVLGVDQEDYDHNEHYENGIAHDLDSADGNEGGDTDLDLYCECRIVSGTVNGNHEPFENHRRFHFRPPKAKKKRKLEGDRKAVRKRGQRKSKSLREQCVSLEAVDVLTEDSCSDASGIRHRCVG